jgi:hypothetical protein
MLASIEGMTFNTFVGHRGSGDQAPYVDLYVDNDGDGSRDDILTFEPVYQTEQGMVERGT